MKAEQRKERFVCGKLINNCVCVWGGGGGGGGGGLVFLYNCCHDGCCETTFISDFIVMINTNCIICTVTDGYNVWV